MNTDQPQDGPAADDRQGGPGKPRAAKPRDEQPYIWCSRAALEKIQRAAGIGNDAAYAVAAYIALCRLSSERGNAASVRVPVKVIGSMIGLRYRKTWAVLQLLEKEARVIRSKEISPGQNDGSEYTLLSFRPYAPRCKGDPGTPLHDGASPPCTKTEQKHADSPKGKEEVGCPNPRPEARDLGQPASSEGKGAEKGYGTTASLADAKRSPVTHSAPKKGDRNPPRLRVRLTKGWDGRLGESAPEFIRGAWRRLGVSSDSCGVGNKWLRLDLKQSGLDHGAVLKWATSSDEVRELGFDRVRVVHPAGEERRKL
jgi:hypothetical protein